MTTIFITQKFIDDLFENAEHQHDILLGVYKKVFPDFDKLNSVGGFPICSNKFSEMMFDRCIDFDKKHHPNVIAGRLWMNNGFSTLDNNHIDDPNPKTFMIDTSSCTPTYIG